MKIVHAKLGVQAQTFTNLLPYILMLNNRRDLLSNGEDGVRLVEGVGINTDCVV